MRARAHDLAILAAGVTAMGTAAILIREAEAPALALAFYRLALASLPLAVFASLRAPRAERRLLSRRPPVLLLAGIALALHFAFWIASLERTSLIASVVLVTTQALFVAVMSSVILRERPPIGVWAAIGLTTAGALLMVSGHFDESSGLTGDLFALLGALFAAVYIVCGRAVRAEGVGWLPYTAAVYSMAAIALAAAVAVRGTSLAGYETRTYVMIALLALLPQLIGHTAMNRSLGYLPATAVSLAIVAEPVVSTALAAVLLDETPSAVEAAGGLVLLAGVYFGLRATTGPTVAVGRPETARLRTR